MKNYKTIAEQLIADLKSKQECLKYIDAMLKTIDQTMTSWKHADAMKLWINVKNEIETTYCDWN